jgi:RNA methyltransferase, TrmH family
MHPLITSNQNPKIKNVLALEKARERNQQNVFIVEGIKELTLALDGKYVINTVFFCPQIIPLEAILKIVKDESLLIPVQQTVFEKIAYRDSTGGVIAIIQQRQHTLNGINLRENPLVLVLESVEKPGNLGAVLRTADAANIDAVIICDPQTDFYNPNVIRSSVGCIFTTQIASATSQEAIVWLRENNVRIFAASLESSTPYNKIDFTIPSAIIMGTESTGLSDTWIRNADSTVIIPMRGKIDSMNVSNAAAVLVFEACRQRGFG